MRLQAYGVGIFEALKTKSAFKKAIKKGLIQVNGCPATTGIIISGGELISLKYTEVAEKESRLVYPLSVLYEDEYLALVHKPAGILVSGNGFKTIAEALPQNLKPSSLKDARKPQPVHRIDYATTGILMVGKTEDSVRVLNGLFEKKQIKKTYYAITIGEMTNSQGTISHDIDNKPALSEYNVEKTVISERFKRLNLVKLNPKTGRRHQLRKHLFKIGNPILGDRDYFNEGLLLKGKGMYLHATTLEFTHPFTGEKISLEDPLPSRFKKIFP
ncbi:RluA family pseudouridine synthase [Roseivirga sp.]|uniref:RluA family pseudouridine synthase n=1 Tax=Roseivirga sp. TaxID=1964215 RepID=UPI003BA9712E